jgi:Ca-activated chloride channel family protein
VRFAIRLDTTAALKNVWSPTHSVEVVRDGEHAAKIAYEANRGSLEDDFLLLYDTDSSDLGMSVIAYKPSEKQPGYFVLTLTPKQLWPKTEYQPQDVVFVIDTSGSMAGEKLDQAKSALKFCIDKLDERDRFSLVRFSTGFDVLFDTPAQATKEIRSEARAWVDKFSAAGGTNIMDALKAALDLRPKGPSGVVIGKNEEDVEGKVIKALAHNDRPFVVIFITDGQGNQTVDETMKMVQKHPAADGARIFPFGVGHDVNTILLDQLATNHSGKPTYVQPGENLELVLSDFFSVISQPVLTNLKLALPEIGAMEKFPATLSDLYHGQQLIVAGKFEKPTTGTVKLMAMRNGESVEYAWPSVAFTNTAEAKYVPAIWAGRKISFLIDQLRAHGENNEMIGEVVSLSQEYGIQTPYTSWLVNPERQPELARRMVHPPPPMSPGSGRPSIGGRGGTGGGGGGSGGAVRGSLSTADAQRRILEHADQGMTRPIETGDGLDELPFDEDAVGQAAGKAAIELAQQNAIMRESKSKDAGLRLDQTRLLNRKIGERWYNRIGQFLVDENVTEETKLTVVKFGTNAYFEVVQRRPELKEALAASRNVVVMVSDSNAILVSDRAGIEDFSEEQLKQSGL